MDFKSILGSIAPTVASALLGPLGGIAVSALGNIMGVDAPTQDKISKAFKEQQLTGEMVAEIKKLELQYQESEKERDFKYKELEFKDTDSARQMQIATQSKIPAILAIIVTMGFFGILIGLMVYSSYKPTEPLLVMLGSLGTAWTMIIGFYFGSSHGSQNKDVLLANAPSAK